MLSCFYSDIPVFNNTGIRPKWTVKNLKSVYFIKFKSEKENDEITDNG
ncbi:hypothetical protein DYBT9275_02147 [Dyadobacter sp. CECT 9275]|uniref:Uncharacterized protein n=1 Tax=Dyadobacter helix TaxID=2822344 RepID=A0A916N5N3_9BACT|nr:hypothetical protein DYBT9275_02147 [Dyadobacter sp. CECT 9275]